MNKYSFIDACCYCHVMPYTDDKVLAPTHGVCDGATGLCKLLMAVDMSLKEEHVERNYKLFEKISEVDDYGLG